MIAVKEYQSASQMMSDYKERRSRLFGPPVVVNVIGEMDLCGPSIQAPIKPQHFDKNVHRVRGAGRKVKRTPEEAAEANKKNRELQRQREKEQRHRKICNTIRRLEGPTIVGVSPIKQYLINRCRELGWSAGLLISRYRFAHVGEQRRMMVWEMRNNLGSSLSEIGRVLGGRDHSTIHNHYKDWQKRVDEGNAEPPPPIFEDDWDDQ